jgi:hypothetical protein
MQVVVLFCAILLAVVGCGAGATRPAVEPTPAETSGAGALVGDMPPDLVFTMDLGGLRSDKSLSKILAKAEASATPDVRELMAMTDKIDLRGSVPNGNPTCVAVLWGHYPKDPTALAALGPASSHPFVAAPTLATGVGEYVGEGDARLFTVSQSVWVISLGGPTEKIRSHFASTPAPPREPDGDLVHVAATGAVMGERKGPVSDLDHAEMTLKAGMTSFKMLLTFTGEEGAKKAEAKIMGLASILLAAINAKAKDCKALQKLEPVVGREGATVSLEMKGIGEAAEAWDPVSCPKLGEDRQERAESAEVPVPVTREPPPQKKPRKRK